MRAGGVGRAVLTSAPLLKLLDALGPKRRMGACKDVMAALGGRGAAPFRDAALVHAALSVARTLHDGLGPLSPEGERRHVAALICAFVAKIDFGADAETHLDVLAEARAAFADLDAVLERLVLAACRLAVRARARGSRGGAFARACLAYAHITVPSIRDALRRLALLRLCAQVALLKGCLPQADASVKAFASALAALPPAGAAPHLEGSAAGEVANLLSTLVCAPGRPGAGGPFYLLQGLLRALRQVQWRPHAPHRARVYMKALALLSCYAQERLPYRVDGVASNDALFARSGAYLARLSELTAAVLGDLRAALDDLKAAAADAHFAVALDLAEQLLSLMEPTAPVADLAAGLLRSAAEHPRAAGEGRRRLGGALRRLRAYCAARAGADGGGAALAPLRELLKGRGGG